MRQNTASKGPVLGIWSVLWQGQRNKNADTKEAAINFLTTERSVDEEG